MATPLGEATTLADQRTEPAPANVHQPRQRIAGATVITEIDDERASLHGALVDKAPIAGIGRVVPIVAQYEILPHWDTQRTPGVTRRVIAPPCSCVPMRYSRCQLNSESKPSCSGSTRCTYDSS